MTPDAGESPKWPWRATFAHWVLGLIAPWLSLTPSEEPEWPDTSDTDAAFDAGMERGYEEAERELRDFRRRDDW